MNLARPDNLIEVDTLVGNFLQEHERGIATLHRVYFHNSDSLSVRALVAELQEELRTGCVTFLNKDLPMEEMSAYLFYIVNDFCKKRAVPLVKKKNTYLCPGCLFLGSENFIEMSNNSFKCDECEAQLKLTVDPSRVSFFRTFFRHSKLGYHCSDCKRFIPHPLDNSPMVSCPYFDCCFVGDWSSLNRMHHPSIQSNPEKLILDSASGLRDALVAQEASAQSKIEIEEALQAKTKLLREVIEYQSNNVPYSSSDFTVKHKYLAYQAFDNLLKKYPVEMVNYLLNKSRSGGFQHKVFQEYTMLLEASLPFSFKKNNKFYTVDSLLDENMNLFGGISVFDGVVNERQIVKNNTQEFYIGGRKARIAQPYFIGKLLGVVNKKTKEPIMKHVVEYTFSLIKMKDILPNTEVTVTHLRVPPHYQMGGMVYVNRIRKRIVDRAQLLLRKEEI